MQPNEREKSSMPPRSMPDDSPARFLAELRALRDHVGIGYAELAARAHYPMELMIAADAGPSLPDLPVLSAYVRGCGGTPAEWEDRWRVLTGSFGEPGLPVRPLGGSAASEAGARAGAAAAPAEDHDPDQIRAVLSRAVSATAGASDTSSVPVSDPGRAPATGPDVWSASDSGLAGGYDTTQLNGHWRSSAPDANAAVADTPPSVLPSPVPVPSTPPPVPSATIRPPDPGETGGLGAVGRHAADLFDRARDGRDRPSLTPATLTLIVVAALIFAGLLLAMVL